MLTATRIHFSIAGFLHKFGHKWRNFPRTILFSYRTKKVSKMAELAVRVAREWKWLTTLAEEMAGITVQNTSTSSEFPQHWTVNVSEDCALIKGKIPRRSIRVPCI
jgi:hypothetical protein